jgi:hypothetical protein
MWGLVTKYTYFAREADGAALDPKHSPCRCGCTCAAETDDDDPDEDEDEADENKDEDEGPTAEETERI